MKILSWIITDEMKLTKNYQMYAVVFGVDVPTTQSQPIESTQGMHRIISATRECRNVEVNNSTFRQDDTQNIPSTRLGPKSNTESLEVEITATEQPVNAIEEEEESAEDDYELRRMENRKHVEEPRSKPSLTTIRSPKIHSTLISSNTEKL
nr:hypothetical protein [Tanacetum cinerariifolium]